MRRGVRVGQIVLYRLPDGFDVPAIVCELTVEGDRVLLDLELFGRRAGTPERRDCPKGVPYGMKPNCWTFLSDSDSVFEA